MPFRPINGLVQAIKSNGEDRDIGLVNAVLHAMWTKQPYLNLRRAALGIRLSGDRAGCGSVVRICPSETKRLVKERRNEDLSLPETFKGWTGMNGSPDIRPQAKA